MVDDITIVEVGSYIKLVNLIKHISRDIFGDVPCYSNPSFLPPEKISMTTPFRSLETPNLSRICHERSK